MKGRYLLRISSLLLFIFLMVLMNIFFSELTGWTVFLQYLIEERGVHGTMIWIPLYIVLFLLCPLMVGTGGFRYLRTTDPKKRYLTFLIPASGLFLSVFIAFLAMGLIFVDAEPFTVFLVSSILPMFVLALFLFIEIVLSRRGKRIGLRKLLVQFFLMEIMFFSIIGEDEVFWDLEDPGRALFFLSCVIVLVLGYDTFIGQWRFLRKGAAGAVSTRPGPLMSFSLDDDLGPLKVLQVEFVLSMTGFLYLLAMVPFIMTDTYIYFIDYLPVVLIVPYALIFLSIPYKVFVIVLRRVFRKDPGKLLRKVIENGKEREAPSILMRLIMNEQRNRTDFYSFERRNEWSRRWIALVLICIGLFFFPIAMDVSRYFNSWGYYLEFSLFTAYLIMSLIMFPTFIMYHLRARNRMGVISVIVLFLLMLTLTLVLGGVMGPFVMDEWEEYLYFDESKLWIIFILVPIIYSLLYPSRKGFFNWKRARSFIFSSILCSICGVIVYVLFNTDAGEVPLMSDFFPHLLYVVPMLLALFISLKDEDRPALPSLKGIKPRSFKGPMKKLAIGGIPVIILILVNPLLFEMHTTFDDWHSYDYHESFPEGAEKDLVTSVLSQDLPDLVHMELYEEGSLMDPNIATMETISDMKEWVEGAREEKAWGDFYVEVDVSISYDHDVIMNRTLQDVRAWDREEDLSITIGPNLTIEIYERGWGSTSIYFNTTEGSCILNNTGFWGKWKNASMDLEITGIDIIEVELSFGSQWGPLAGYGGYLTQYIGIRGQEVIFLYAERSNWIS